MAVVGGGPAGSFFAIHLLRRARELGRAIDVLIFEKKREVCFYKPSVLCWREGCNYCAGGISPRLADILRANGIVIPADVIESRATEVIVHGDWKSIQLPVPRNREMLSVFRGSRPRKRADRHANLDTFLLHAAESEGARVITAEVRDFSRTDDGKPRLEYLREAPDVPSCEAESLEADFLAFAAGVNQAPSMVLNSDPTIEALKNLLPRFRPPRVRRAAIVELQAEEGVLSPLAGEVHFAQHGSKKIDIEMSSLLPKGRWLTVVLVGKTIDRADPSRLLQIVQDFVALPHIRLLLPPRAELRAGCCCNPNMTVGAAKHYWSDRVAATGDIAVSRLYKDGLYSAYVTASALADCIIDRGADHDSIAAYYAPVIKHFQADNRYGRAIFFLSRWVFGNPALSRVLYQALITERMTKPQSRHRLGNVLWHIASGDDTYRHILSGMFQPGAIWLILTGGLLATVRNQATEALFGLDWEGFGRFQTGVPLEQVDRKRLELFTALQAVPPKTRPHLERVFSIQIRADEDAVFRQLGTFGDPDRGYFHPRFIHVHRVSGRPNEVGTVIRYDLALGMISFGVRLERLVPDKYLLYRILDGFGKGGIFAFDVARPKPGVSLLTTYVGFDFPRGQNLLGRVGWALARRLFPLFAHDALWNHSLCRIKHLSELDDVTEGDLD